MFLRNGGIRVALLVIAAVVAGFLPARADDWPLVSPDELKMTNEPLAPGAPAIILDRRVDHRDADIRRPYETNYYRIKILTEEGRKYAEVEIPYIRGREDVFGIEGRTIQPDGSIVKFDGKASDKTIEKTKGVRYPAKTFTLPGVQVGSIIEYRYGKDWEEFELYDSHWIVSEDLFTKHARFSMSPFTEEIYTCRWTWKGLPPGSEVPKLDPRGVVRLELQNIAGVQQEDYEPPGNALKARVDFIYSEGSYESNPDKYWKREGNRMFGRVGAYVDKGNAMEQAVAGIVAAGDSPEAKLRKIYARVQQMHNLSFEREKTAQGPKRGEYNPNSNAIWESGPGDFGVSGPQILSPPRSGGVPGLGAGGVGSPGAPGAGAGITGPINQNFIEKHDYLKDSSKLIGNVESTWERGSGDRADLTWLFLGLARAAGFEASPVMVASRSEYFFNPDEMNVRQLSGDVVQVKLNGQDLFFAPGAKFVPYGLLPWTETGVTGLRLDKDGGAWIKTPIPPSSTSRTVRQADLKLGDTGTIQGKLTVTYTGHEASLRRQEESYEDTAARKKFLEDEVKSWIPASGEVELKNAPDWDNSAETLVAEFALKVPGLAADAGQRMLLAFGFFGGSERHVFEQADRVQDVSFQFPYEETDDITIELPPGWQLGTVPQVQNMDSAFCGYALQAEDKKGMLHLTRSLVMHGVWLDRQYYATLHEFFQTVRTEDELAVVFLPVTVAVRKLNPESNPTSANPVPVHQLNVPEKARRAFKKGAILLTAKSDYGAAVDEFRRAITLYPSYYEAYGAMGLAKYKLGDAVGAEAAYRKSVELNPEEDPDTMIDLAWILNILNRFTEAETILRKVLAADDSSWRGHFELAVALVGLERPAEAAVSAAKASDLNPNNPQNYLLLYNIHVLTDNYSSALRDADAYLEIVTSGPMNDRMRRLREQVRNAQEVSQGQPAQATPATGTASLKISLRLQDSVPFSGSARLRLTGARGFETTENRTAGSGVETVFPNLRPGSYVFEASAPGFVTVKQDIEIKLNHAPETLFLIMKPESPSGAASESKTPPPPSGASVIPRGVDDSVPEVAADVPCSLFRVLHGAGLRMEQLVDNLQKFSASERVEHFPVSVAGVRGAAEVRSFDYLAVVSQDPQRGFEVNEYRNGSMVRPQQFPGGIATSNLPAHALMFHPSLVFGFNFTCEGLGQWKGHPAWLVHFEEKLDKPSPFRAYVIDGNFYPVLLKGRAWIDAGTYQVVRMESDLLKPVDEIRLTRDHVSIDYGLVQFRARNEQLWLPQTADVYAEWGRHRFYRRHTFSDFQIFSVNTAQEVHSPKESYCFTNTSDRTISGILTVTSVSRRAPKPASLTVTIPAGGTICKNIGPGEDINIPAEALGPNTTFAHNGPPGSVQVDAYLVKEIALELIPNSPVPTAPNP